MNIKQMKEDAEFCKGHNFTSMASVAPQDVLDLIADYEGAQFAAASHLRTVEQQAKIIAGNSDKALVAEALAVFDLMLVGCTVPNFADYQNGDGEEIGARMDALHAALKTGQGAPIQSGAVRNQALEEAATYLADVHSIGLADEIRALASTPSAAMEGQGDTKAAFEAWAKKDGTYDLRGPKCIPISHGGVPHTGYIKPYENDRTRHTFEGFQAAQPQAGGRELTDADIRRIVTAAYKAGELSWLGFDIDPTTGTYCIPVLSACHYQLARAIEAHITGTKGATEESK